MSSIFDFVRQQSSVSSRQPASNSSIFEAARQLPEDNEPSRARSILSAPVKGFLKGFQGSSEFSPLMSGPIPSKLAGRAIEQVLPTQNKLPERSLERGGKIASYLISPGKALPKLIRGIAGTALGQTAQEFGAPEWLQSGIEMGAFLTPTSVKGAEKHISSLYGQAESLAKGDKVSAKNLAKSTNRFISDLSRGGPATSKNAALSQAESVLKKIKEGKIDVKELTEYKKSINEARGSLYSDQSLSKTGRKSAKKNLDDVSKIVDNSLSEYGKTNPEWNKAYRDANEGFGAIQNSKKVSKWIERLIKQHPHASGIAIAGSLIGHSISPKSIFLTGTALGGIKTAELMTRISKSPVLRKYYKEAFNSAIKENPAAFLNNMKKIEESFKEDKIE